MKKLPIGVENYIDIINDCYYVDKTLILEEITSSPATSVLLFTRPRRFGKSLMLSMIRTFFDKKINNISYFENTKIFNNKDVMSNLGKYDVIYLNMKDINANDSKNLIIKTKQIIIDQIKEFDWIKEMLDNSSIKEFEEIKNINVDDILFTSSIKKLCKLINIATGKRPILLIDEYDSPIQTAFENGYYNEIIDFYKSLYSESLKGNNDLYLSIVTGISRTGKLSLFSGLNNLIDINIFNDTYSNFFGFTENEVKELLKEYNLIDNYDEVKEWYGGYKFGNNYIFNPWSVLHYIKNKGTLDIYWSKTTSTDIILPSIAYNTDMFENIEKIINKDLVLINTINSTDYNQINNNFDSFASFLLSTGYITVDEKYDIDTYSVKSVNKETDYALINEIKTKFIKKDTQLIGFKIKNAIKNGNIEEFKANIENYLLSSFTYHDFNDEKNYQIFLLTLLSLLFDECYVESEIPTGTGRCDIIIRPKTNSDFGAIIEIKYLKSRTTSSRLKSSSDEALNQIMKHKYYQKILNSNANKIYAYGISFYKNNVSTSLKSIK